MCAAGKGTGAPGRSRQISVERSGFFALVQRPGRCRPRCSKHLSTGGPSRWQRPRRSRATWTSCSSGTPGATRARSPPTFPELASADPDLFGICLATVDGALYEAGDTRAPFTIQSMSKPLTYGLALELAGEEAVRSRVGVEPSGDPFNEISLRAGTGTPVNPMINAGAITCAGLVFEASDAPMELLLETYSTYAGRPLEIDEAVYRSEADTGHRNRAIAHLLRGHEVLVSDPEAALDLYFRQCSVNVDCRDLALVAATLANGGVNPRHRGPRRARGRRAQRPQRDDDVRDVRRRRRVARLRRHPGEERRVRRGARRAAGAPRRRRLLPAARRAGKQRARRRRLPRPLPGPRAPPDPARRAERRSDQDDLPPRPAQLEAAADRGRTGRDPRERRDDRGLRAAGRPRLHGGRGDLARPARPGREPRAGRDRPAPRESRRPRRRGLPGRARRVALRQRRQARGVGQRRRAGVGRHRSLRRCSISRSSGARTSCWRGSPTTSTGTRSRSTATAFSTA